MLAIGYWPSQVAGESESAYRTRIVEEFLRTGKPQLRVRQVLLYWTAQSVEGALARRALGLLTLNRIRKESFDFRLRELWLAGVLKPEADYLRSIPPKDAEHRISFVELPVERLLKPSKPLDTSICRVCGETWGLHNDFGSDFSGVCDRFVYFDSCDGQLELGMRDAEKWQPFDKDGTCTCSTTPMPPCGWCTHPDRTERDLDRYAESMGNERARLTFCGSCHACLHPIEVSLHLGLTKLEAAFVRAEEDETANG